MSHKIKIQKAITLLLIIYLLNGCYVVKEKNLIDSTKIYGTDKITGNSYSYDVKAWPNPDNPYANLELYEVGKYSYKTVNKYEKVYVPAKGAIHFFGISCSVLFGVICSNNPAWFQPDTKPEDAFWAGVTIGAIPWLIAVLAHKDKKVEYIYEPGKEQIDYKKSNLLSNTEIKVIQNKKELNFFTNANGLMKFSPSFDFQLDDFKINDSIEFLFNYKNNPFIKSMKLTPSDWLKKYAKIKIPNSMVFDTESSKNLGTARQGMLYKFISEQNGNINIQYGSYKGSINKDDAEILYTNSRKTDYTAAVKNYVTDEMQKWLKQGEFERPEAYIQRISKKDEQLLVLTNQAMKTLQKEYADTYNWKESSIDRYDPNSQTFKIKTPELQEIILNVPIEKAQSFKENWSANLFKNQEFTLIDGEWKLVSLEIENPNDNYTASYDSKIANNYDPTNQFAFDLKDFEVEIPDLSITQNQAVKQNLETIDQYSIKTDLPVTKMSQPDAIAIVIGNAYYQKTDPVNYAINDAQLMKLYLTNVLGFKEGNIIFTMNATKAEFEGLFGTDANHKGKLFNYIKPDISDVFIFYSGHGAPDSETKDAYFIPTDCDPDYVSLQGYALKTLYGNLAKLPTKSTTIIIDACFSGGGVLKNISSVRIKPNNSEDNIRNSAILSSSTGIQVSSWYNEKRQGLFTYFFLKAIHDYKNSDNNGDKELTFNEIYNYISDKTEGIPYFARRLNAVEQTPVLSGSNKERVLVRFGD